MDKTDGGTSTNVRKYEFDDEDLLVAVFMGNKCTRSSNQCAVQDKQVKKVKGSKGTSSSLVRGNSGRRPRSLVSPRTVLSWLINSEVVSLNEVIQLCQQKDDAVVKEGLVTRTGILCLCCNTSLSISEFVSHADFKSAWPSMNLFMTAGKPLALCQLEAWSAEYQAKKLLSDDKLVERGDDVCGRCGLEGELVWCDNCPATFHQACLLEQLPEGNWFCLQCRCLTCWDVNNDKNTSGTLKCSFCEHKYHETCMQSDAVNTGLGTDKWFCGQTCLKLYDGLESLLGLRNQLSEEVSWMLLHCINGGLREYSSTNFIAMKAECNAKLAVASRILEDYFLPMVDKRTDIDMIPQVIFNRRSKFPRLNFKGFYTIILEKKDTLVSVASIRVHGLQVAELPFIATCGNFRNQGLCRILVSTIEKILKSLEVRSLVVPAAGPELVEMWTRKYGFQLMDEDGQKLLMSQVNLIVLPGSTWLMLKSLEVRSLAVSAARPMSVEMWTKKYGFQPMDEDAKKLLMRKVNLMVLPGSA